MSNKDYDRIAAFEKAIKEKYGSEAIANPKSNWNEEKEKEYLIQMKEHYAIRRKNEEREEKVEADGFKVSKKLLNRESLKNCPVCNAFPKSVKDDIYLLKYDCCNKCYIQYVEGREDKWLKGWRPNNGNSL